MAIYCYITDCKYFSKRKSQHINKNGNALHRCTAKNTVITDHGITFEDHDGSFEPEDNMCRCMSYEKIN